MANIYVFGSNLAGVHGAGSARHAHKKHGAKWGVGVGPIGNSYAIPTKDEKLETMPLDVIRQHVTAFLHVARSFPENTYDVVAIGCGLAGYKPHQIAPMFEDVPPNVMLPEEFVEILAKKEFER